MLADNPITLLIAHPDDEIIFMFPALQAGSVTKIVCLSSDAMNPDREWCKDRKFALKEIGEQIGAEVIVYDNDSEFYRLPTRDETLKNIAKDAIERLSGVVFSHNTWGEYGHLDHIIASQIAVASGREYWTTDICVDLNWLPVREQFAPGSKYFMDPMKYEHWKAIYDARGCWTWSHKPIMKCGVFRVC